MHMDLRKKYHLTRYDAIVAYMSYLIIKYIKFNDLKRIFSVLAEEWRRDVIFTSSITDMVMHPAYQRIIGMGPVAVPLLLKELEREPDHWFWALRAITGENPVSPEQRGKLDDMTEAWLSWGREKGYV